MPKIFFTDAEDQAHTVDFDPGTSVMEVAVRNDINGILAECGGACSCSTCHVVLEQRDFIRFDAPDSMEESLLDFTAAPRQPTSRLACQLRLTEDHDGANIKVAK